MVARSVTPFLSVGCLPCQPRTLASREMRPRRIWRSLHVKYTGVSFVIDLSVLSFLDSIHQPPHGLGVGELLDEEHQCVTGRVEAVPTLRVVPPADRPERRVRNA